MLSYTYTVYFSVFVLGKGVSSEQKAVSPLSAATTFAGPGLLYTHMYVYVQKGKVMYIRFVMRLTLGGQSGVSNEQEIREQNKGWRYMCDVTVRSL